MYLSEFMTLELAACHRNKHPKVLKDDGDEYVPPDLSPMCLAKLICLKNEVGGWVGDDARHSLPYVRGDSLICRILQSYLGTVGWSI